MIKRLARCVREYKWAAILAPAINMVCRKLGWVKDGDMKIL